MNKKELLKRKGAIKKVRSKFGKSVLFELLILRSNKHIYGQVIRLSDKCVIFSTSTLGRVNVNCRNKEQGKILGEKIATMCNEKNIKSISFNRANNRFHGVVKSFVDGFYSVLK